METCRSETGTRPILGCLNLVQHLQLRCLQESFLPLETKRKYMHNLNFQRIENAFQFTRVTLDTNTQPVLVGGSANLRRRSFDHSKREWRKKKVRRPRVCKGNAQGLLKNTTKSTSHVRSGTRVSPLVSSLSTSHMKKTSNCNRYLFQTAGDTGRRP